MTSSADSIASLEQRAEQSIGEGVNWAVHAAGDAYKATKSLVPLPEEYRDAALVGAALVVGAVAGKPLLSRVLAGSEAAVVKAEGVHIVPLTRENLPRAVAAAKEGFSYGGPFLSPAKDFKASLDPLLNARRLSMDPKVEANARYWLAVDKKGNVLGTTGLYETGKDQAEAAWMGWMSVRPAYRGQGIGKMLVDFSKEQAAADGKQFLRLYTSNARGEAAAQVLYEKEGLRIVGSEPHTIPRFLQILGGEKKPLQIVFREVDLRPRKIPGIPSGPSGA
ncbi:MAG: GNAT family N-acetyltransferase [Cyanobacteria bacterium SZAS LIN-3]|nr:GNAT family N-acetyltransferase [Cyanobacteria bacterium SZAS LIN-3]MBS2009155.1 GNAT family N-acetyltransferase [Cyanobacteria bacterium SZAS TMP-1]